MAYKKSGGSSKGSGGKANFTGTYACFPDPMENQGSKTNKGSVKAALDMDKPKKGSGGSLDPLRYRPDARAELEDLNEHPKMGQNKITEITKSTSSFGPADRSYTKGSKK